jgi:H+/Cl- antiporter ClcA
VTVTTDHKPLRTARPAVVLAEVSAVVVGLGVATLLVAFAIGGDPAISDTFIAYLAGVAMVGGLFGSLIAFLLAGFARIRHEVAARLWLPLALFPALLTLLVLAEVFWLE